LSSFIVVIMTVANREEAINIVRQLLREKLIACANIVGSVNSLYWWKGKIEESREFLVLMKTRENLFEKLAQKVKELHSYEVPEVIALPLVKGLPAYLSWLNACLKSTKSSTYS